VQCDGFSGSQLRGRRKKGTEALGGGHY